MRADFRPAVRGVDVGPETRPGPYAWPLKWIVLSLDAFIIFGFGIFANGVFLLSSLLMPFSAAKAYRINSSVAGTLWYFMQRSFERQHRGVVTFSGDKLPYGESAFIVSNHCSYSDYYLLHAVALRHGMLPFCRYFAKFELVWQIPIFGVSMWLIDMVLVRRNWTRDRDSTRKAFAAIKRHGQPVWLISYLEGHRRTAARLDESQSFAKKREKPVLKHVLLPRTKGFVASIQALRDDSQIKHLYDFTLAYRGPHGELQRAPSLSTIHTWRRLSPPMAFHVHVRRYALADLPHDDAGLATFAEDLFAHKDGVLEGMGTEWIDAPQLTGSSAGVYQCTMW